MSAAVDLPPAWSQQRPATEFRLLGPLEASVDGKPVALRSPKQRSLLAALLLRAGHTVRAEDLVTHLWEGDLPSNSRSALHVHMTRLRSALKTACGTQLIQSVPAGYRIELPEGALDLARFDAAVAEAAVARQDGDLAAEAVLLDKARSLWRGRALLDVPSSSLQRDEVPALNERLLQVSERYAELELRLGRHQGILAELRTMTAEHPYRERLWCLLMLSLYRADRQAEALSCYQEVTRRLRGELGIEPGERLAALHQLILTGVDSVRAFGVLNEAPSAPRPTGQARSLRHLGRTDRTERLGRASLHTVQAVACS